MVLPVIGANNISSALTGSVIACLACIVCSRDHRVVVCQNPKRASCACAASLAVILTPVPVRRLLVYSFTVARTAMLSNQVGTQLEVGCEEIASDLLQARFWITIREFPNPRIISANPTAKM